MGVSVLINVIVRLGGAAIKKVTRMPYIGTCGYAPMDRRILPLMGRVCDGITIQLTRVTTRAGQHPHHSTATSIGQPKTEHLSIGQRLRVQRLSLPIEAFNIQPLLLRKYYFVIV